MSSILEQGSTVSDSVETGHALIESKQKNKISLNLDSGA